MTPLLIVNELSVSYGPVPAVVDLSFEVNEGEVFAILGPNAAGKSSTLHAIMGLVGRQPGSVTLDGQSLMGRSPDQIARLGVSLVPEGRNIFGDLTVQENLRLGAMGRRSREGLDEDLEWALDLFPIVKDYLPRQAGVLSGGQQQQLAIARALVANPRLLMLDEPSLGLAPTIIDSVFDSLEQIRQSGRTIVIVEQRAARTMEFADRSLVMAGGSVRLRIDDNDSDVADATAAAYFGS